jgi:L-ribulose-5-phosphate 4-epimerase
LTNPNLKQSLVDCIRMLERANHIDFNGHASVRVPGSDTIMINSKSSSRSSLTVDDIVTIDLDGKVISGNGEPPNEFPLHTRIYANKDNVKAVIHTHPQWSTLFTITKIPIKPVIVQGAVVGDIPVFPKSNSISNNDIANEMVNALGEHKAILLKAHGAVFAAEGLVEAFVLSCFLELNAHRQYMASQIGEPQSLEDDEVKQLTEFLWQPKNIQKVWDNHYSKLVAN